MCAAPLASSSPAQEAAPLGSALRPGSPSQGPSHQTQGRDAPSKGQEGGGVDSMACGRNKVPEQARVLMVKGLRGCALGFEVLHSPHYHTLETRQSEPNKVTLLSISWSGAPTHEARAAGRQGWGQWLPSRSLHLPGKLLDICQHQRPEHGQAQRVAGRSQAGLRLWEGRACIAEDVWNSFGGLRVTLILLLLHPVLSVLGPHAPWGIWAQLYLLIHSCCLLS